MASFGGVDLGADGAGVFELISESDDENFMCRLADGSVAVIPPNSRYVVVRQCPGVDFAATHTKAREAANQALDLYFGQGGRPVLIAHKDSPYVVCWNSPTGYTLRIVGRNQVSSRLRAKAVAYGSDGKVVEQSPPPKVWQESLRYYRVSESATDLYDSFRNLYLAIEALLSHVVPPQARSDGRAEGDGDWLERALRDVCCKVDLTPYAPASPKAPWNAIHQELYANLRTAIFHAKTGRATWAPQDWSSRVVIVEARLRYARMFRALAAAYLDASYTSGGLFRAFWEGLWEANLSGHEVFVSSDPTMIYEESRGEYQLAPAGGAFTKLHTVAADDMTADWCRGVEGVAAASTIHEALGEVRRFGTLHDGELAIVESLRAPLVVEDIGELQVVLLIEGRNYGAPRQDFES